MANTRRAKKADVTELIASAALPERTVSLCVRGDLVAEVERLERELAALRAGSDTRLSGNAEARKIATRIEDLREQMQSATVEFTMRAMRRRDFQKFLAAHPPREGNAVDRAVGFNTETYIEGLVRECIVTPEITDEQWDTLCDSMTAAQWQEFVDAAKTLNMERVSVPFSLRASLLLQASDEK